MALPAQLHGPRLALRAWNEDHIDTVLDAIAASLPELRMWMPWAQQLPTRQQELDVLREGRLGFQRGEDFPFFLFERHTEDFIGAAGVHSREPGVAEIGYWVRTDRHHRGYATEAVVVLTNAAFTHLPELHTLEIRMDQANHASAAVPPKVRYTRTGEEAFRERLAAGHTGHGWIWTLERTDWTRQQPQRAPISSTEPRGQSWFEAPRSARRQRCSGRRPGASGSRQYVAGGSTLPPGAGPVCPSRCQFEV